MVASCADTDMLCSLPTILDHVQQRAAADMLLLGQVDAGQAVQAVQETAQSTASGNKPGFFNFFANTFEVVLKVTLLFCVDYVGRPCCSSLCSSVPADVAAWAAC